MNLTARRVVRSGALVVLCLGLCTGVTCTVSPGGDSTHTVTLDQASAVMKIQATVGAAQASVAATLTDKYGVPIALSSDQYVRVNDNDLVGSGLGAYSARVAVAGQYVVAVREPTRGVSDTTAAAPADFEIVSPRANDSASLSGFTVTWSAATAGLRVQLQLTQVLFGRTTTRSFGPYEDDGGHTLSATDLVAFRQGAPLTLTVTKATPSQSVNGFKNGTLSVEVALSQALLPAP